MFFFRAFCNVLANAFCYAFAMTCCMSCYAFAMFCYNFATRGHVLLHFAFGTFCYVLAMFCYVLLCNDYYTRVFGIRSDEGRGLDQVFWH